ncbi:toprim domain-containing protein [Sphingobacterium siyangense]|uniref:toprim domain-containing protein n=1 Tax=Sphingobacterium siyangense TaxID=459529 RepID=UPI00301A3BB8
MEKKQKLSCEQLRSMDMVTYLSRLGYEPAKIKGNDHWYYSLFRDEKTPSFKVNRRTNRWYDFGEGAGGSLIDFGIKYNNSTIGEFLALVANDVLPVNSFINESTGKIKEPPKIEILKVKPIVSPGLIRYIAERRISLYLADRYLKEVNYSNNFAKFYALGFENDKGGYELRSSYFKGSSSPKYYTHFKNNSDTICVFEGFMDFLTFLQISDSEIVDHFDYLILNSLSFTGAGIVVMQLYQNVHLYLDNNDQGNIKTQQIKTEVAQAEDKRTLYKNHEDLNAFLCFPGTGIKPK